MNADMSRVHLAVHLVQSQRFETSLTAVVVVIRCCSSKGLSIAPTNLLQAINKKGALVEERKKMRACVRSTIVSLNVTASV